MRNRCGHQASMTFRKKCVIYEPIGTTQTGWSNSSWWKFSFLGPFWHEFDTSLRLATPRFARISQLASLCIKFKPSGTQKTEFPSAINGSTSFRYLLVNKYSLYAHTTSKREFHNVKTFLSNFYLTELFSPVLFGCITFGLLAASNFHIKILLWHCLIRRVCRGQSC